MNKNFTNLQTENQSGSPAGGDVGGIVVGNILDNTIWSTNSWDGDIAEIYIFDRAFQVKRSPLSIFILKINIMQSLQVV